MYTAHVTLKCYIKKVKVIWIAPSIAFWPPHVHVHSYTCNVPLHRHIHLHTHNHTHTYAHTKRIKLSLLKIIIIGKRNRPMGIYYPDKFVHVHTNTKK